MTTYELQPLALKSGVRADLADFENDDQATAWADGKLAEWRGKGYRSGAQLLRFPAQQIGFAGIQRNRGNAASVTVYSGE